MFLLFGVLFYLSDILENKFGVEGIAKGAILAVPLGALCASSYLTGKFIGENKKRMKWVSAAGWMLLTAAILAASWRDHPWLLTGLLVPAGIGVGAALPCMDALITEGIAKENRGTVTSLYGSMRFIGVSLGPPTVSFLTGAGHRTVFLSLAAVCLAGVLVTVLFIRPKAAGGTPPAGGLKPGRPSGRRRIPAP